MQSLILYINLCFILISCLGKEIEHVTNSPINQNNDSLINVYYNRATNLSGEEKIKYEKLFFATFPNNFKDFSLLYGFKDTAMPLYSAGNKHLNLLDSLTAIEPKEYYSKYINIAIGGIWDADNVSDFQSILYHKIDSNPSLTILLLSKYSNTDIKRFWHFVFDGPHPDGKHVRKMFENLYLKIKSIDKGMAIIMKNEYDILIRKSEVHGH